MKNLLHSSVVHTASHILYENVLLDRDFAGYFYHPQIPVFLYFGTGNEVGQAWLHEKEDSLYATLQLNPGFEYTGMFPHIPFDVRGRIQAVVLSSYACYDEAIPMLNIQTTTPGNVKDVV